MRLNGIDPPIGTLLPGIEPLVVTGYTSDSHYESEDDTFMCVCGNEWLCPDWYMGGVELRAATNADFMQANLRKPAEVHSVYEHNLIPPRRTVFGLARVMG